MPPTVRSAFQPASIVISLDRILPIRQIKPSDSHFGKYRTILASIREIGLIEPLVVYPQKQSDGCYVLLDGHMRLKALLELGKRDAACIVATTDDAFTYNDKVNRLAPIQEHRMILRAVKDGVTAEEIGKALAIDVDKIRRSLEMLDGIHPDAIDILKEKPVTPAALRVFKKVKALRQLDFAQMMVATGNYTHAYARALLLGTPNDMLVESKSPKAMRGMKREDTAQMEKEMEVLEKDFRAYQDTYGQNTLSLNGVQRYVVRLLGNQRVKRFLAKRYSDILEELTAIAELEAL